MSLSYTLIPGLPQVVLSPFSEKIGVTWTNGNVWDPPVIQLFYNLLSAHPEPFVAIDVGAQTGSFTLLSKFFPDSRWFSFEPIQEAADTLKENLRLNEIDWVSVQQMAVSDKPGKGTLFLPPMNDWGLATLGSNVLRFSTASQREVDCIDLDSFVESRQIERVHFIKLDTEGWELNALKGASRLVQKDRPILLLECNETNLEQCRISKEELFFWLHNAGYRGGFVSSEDLLCLPQEKTL